MRAIFQRRFVRLGLLGLVGLCVLLFSYLWYGAEQMVSPMRRQLEGYHQSWLKTPEEHGVVLRQLRCEDGNVPYLLVEPDEEAGEGERGGILREQLKSRGQKLEKYGNIRSLLIMLHGRTGRKEDLLPAAERFCAAGFVCVIPDLPAHGENDVEKVCYGSTENEMKLAQNVANAARVVLDRADLPASLWGMSMGGAFAIQSAAAFPGDWQRLVVVASFDRLEGLVQNQVKSQTGLLAILAFPAFQSILKMRGEFKLSHVNPVEAAARLQCPTLIVHGDDDEVIPMEHGRALFDALTVQEKDWEVVEGGGHANVLVTPEPLYARMAEWLLKS